MPDAAHPRSLTELGQAARFQLLIDAVKDYAIYLLDADGRVATWNPGAQLFKGYAAEEILGEHFSVFYTEEDRIAGVPDRALATAFSEGRFEAEGWRVRKTGARFWAHVVIQPVLDADGGLIGFAKITRDVSEKRAADRALLESERRFRLLVQGVHDYAIYMLDPDGNVSNWNAGATAIKGYEASEIIGRHFSLFYTPEDRAAGAPARALATALREGKFEGEAQRVRKNGERFWANVVIDPIRDEEGTLIGFAKVTRDVTERRRAQEEIERSREALAQAQKMEAIGRLTGGVAHDFNNLLTVILASAEFLRQPGLGDERRERYLKAISQTAERAALLTNQLLAFARRQPLQPEVFEVGATLAGLRQLIASTVGSAVNVSLRTGDAETFVEADPAQFEHAILNVVINARDAMPRGGTIDIAVTAARDAPGLAAADALDSDFVAITLEDTGCGMTPETLSRIFEPFFTTKTVEKGSGLGLSQVYGFAKQSRGDVTARSTFGKGTTVTLYLPRAQGRDLRAEPVAAPSVVDAAQRRVLLVEDNEDVGAFATDLLRELGQEVTWVGDGQKALQVLKDQAPDFDLVFSDVVMPGMSGIELGEEIRLRWPDLRIVLTSGYSHVLAEEGDHGFPLLRKPYSVAGLLGVLRPGDEPRSVAANPG